MELETYVSLSFILRQPIPANESEKQRKQWILKKESGQEGQQKWIDPNKDSYFLLTLDLPVEGKRR